MSSESTSTGSLKFCLSPLDGDPFNQDSGNQKWLKPPTTKKPGTQLGRTEILGDNIVQDYSKIHLRNCLSTTVEFPQQYRNRNCETQWPRTLKVISFSSDFKSLQLPGWKHLLEADNNNYSKACWLFEAGFNAQSFKHIWFFAEHRENSISDINTRQRLRVQ